MSQSTVMLFKLKPVSRKLRKICKTKESCKMLAREDYTRYCTYEDESILCHLKYFWKYLNTRKGNSDLPKVVTNG